MTGSQAAGFATSDEEGRDYEAERSLAAHVLLRAYQDYTAPRPFGLSLAHRGMERRWAVRRRDAFAWLFGLDGVEGDETLRAYCAFAAVSVGYLQTVLRQQHPEVYRDCAAEWARIGPEDHLRLPSVAVYATK